MTNLARIRKKVRRLTGTPSGLQLTDAEIDEYINDFYMLDLEAHLKLFDLNQVYSFYTMPNEDRYEIDTGVYTNVVQPLYIAGYQSYYTQSRQEFYRLYPRIDYSENLFAGTASQGPYDFTLTYQPILRREFFLTTIGLSGATLVVQDDGNGNLFTPNTTIPSRGTINYQTGVGRVTFPEVIPITSQINAQYVPITLSRPTVCLFFEKYFFLRPVPDKAYKVDIEVFRTPTQLLSANVDSPDVDQWWQYIAFGAAFKILEDRNDFDAMQGLAPRLDEQKQLVLYKTTVQLTQERTATIYTDQASRPSIGNYWNGSV